jgi:hypothetical protein
MRTPARRPAQDPDNSRKTIEEFLQGCKEPALLEPGEELFPIGAENFTLEAHAGRLTLQAWDRTRNLVRRVTGVKGESGGRLELAVERFARKEGQLFLLDLSRRSGSDLGRRSGRLVFRERFRLFVQRQFPEWKVAEVSAQADLEHSLSPAFPRAFLRHGQHGWAAIACPPDGDAGGVLSFGLIWLSHLRARERRLAVEGLALYVPAGRERQTALRLLCFDDSAARFELFSYSEQDYIARIDPRDHGNIDTRIEPYCRPRAHTSALWSEILESTAVERVYKNDGRVSLRVRGLQFGEIRDGELRFGVRSRRLFSSPAQVAELESLIAELSRVRSPESTFRDHPLYRQSPEAWLEFQVRTDLETIDASLLPTIYGQVPAFAGGDRGVLDLLGVDRAGRLAVIELKASADIHLPLQALDYWVRVKWHLDRDEFRPKGYFPDVALHSKPPRLLLVSPALEFHPTTESILSYVSPAIDVERIGLGVEWRKSLQVMFRLKGADRPL